MKHKKWFAAVVVLLSALATNTHGATYWVSKSGSDANACFNSATEPTLATQSKLTIAAGLTCLSSGDTLKIKVGTYTEAISNPISGVTIEGVSGETITLRPTGSSAIFQISVARSNITVRNLIFDCINGSSTSCRGVNTTTTAVITGLLIEHTRTTNYRNDGFVIGDATDGATIRYNKVDTFLSGDASPSNALYFRGANSIIEYNEFGPDIRDGLSVRSDVAAPGNIYRYNRWHDGSSSDTGSRMINISKAAASNPTLFHNNIIETHNRSGIRVTANADGVKFYNNTLYNISGTCFVIDAGAVGTEFINNICRTSGGIFSDAGTDTVKTTNACASGVGCSVTADPLLIDPANADFNLAETSPAIDAGTTISGFSSGRCVGAGCDIGAIEAPIRSSTVVEDSDRNTYRISFSMPSQSVRAGTGLKSCTFTDFALRDDGVGKTESACTITGTSRADVDVSDGDFTAGVIDDAYTRGTLTDNVGIGCGPNDGACLHAKVRSYSATAGTNNIGGGGGATHNVVHVRQFNWYSSVASPTWKRLQDVAGGVQASGRIALAVTIECTGANCDPTPYEWYFNTGGGDALITDSVATNPIGFASDAPSLSDQAAISSLLSGLTCPHGSFVTGSVVGKQITQPSIDLTQNSCTTLIGLFQTKSDATGTINIKPKLPGGTAISYGVTPSFVIKAPEARF